MVKRPAKMTGEQANMSGTETMHKNAFLALIDQQPLPCKTRLGNKKSLRRRGQVLHQLQMSNFTLIERGPLRFKVAIMD